MAETPESENHGQPAPASDQNAALKKFTIPLGDPNDPLSHEIVEIAGTLEDVDDAKRYFVAAAKYSCRELLLELARAWPEIRDVAKKTAKNGETAATAKMAVGLKFDLTNLNVLSVEFSFAVAPFVHKFATSTAEDLTQLSLDFVACTITKHQAATDEGGGDGSETSGNGAGGAQGDETAETLLAKDRDSLLAICVDRSIEVPARCRKEIIVELILSKK